MSNPEAKLAWDDDTENKVTADYPAFIILRVYQINLYFRLSLNIFHSCITSFSFDLFQ
ncbi:hypothetical protein F385_2823 [Pantoea agglomerans 299R]|nr:hypothetical protein F385_2823 [Pantoea agglomerans 299R]